MFIKLNKTLRRLILLLGIVYTLSGTGLATFALQSAHDYYAHVIFPCKGSGCACDKAGYELRGCRCDHTQENEKSCCSEDEPKEPSQNSSCCSEEKDDIDPIHIKPAGCQGETDDDRYSVVKHCPIDPPGLSYKYLYHSSQHGNSVKSLFSVELFPQDKIPIFS